MADLVEKDATQPHVQLVEHTVIAHTQFEFRPSLQPLVWKRFQPRAHFIHSSLHRFADRNRQRIKRAGVGG